jgi:hypothetical protein
MLWFPAEASLDDAIIAPDAADVLVGTDRGSATKAERG